MKRITIGILILILVTLPLAGCGGIPSSVSDTTPAKEEPEVKPEPAEDADFRNVNWGMSRAEVKKRETEGTFLGGEGEYQIYTDLSVAGLDVALGYCFNIEGQLYKATYLIEEEHSNDTAYICDYENLQGKLIDKYGEPSIDSVIWYDDLWKDDPDDWGMALITGDLKYLSVWELDSVEVSLTLTGDNYEVNVFSLVYQSNDISGDTGETGDEGL